MFNLQSLIAHTNLLRALPPDFSKLRNLVIVVLSFNRLHEFPKVLCQLHQVWLRVFVYGMTCGIRSYHEKQQLFFSCGQ